MILFRDLFDLDDCFRCLLSGSVFHGGDPAVAGNWQLPAEFFEKYWFLTIDYNLRRYTNEWRKKQGLEEIQPPAPIDLRSLSPPQQSLSQPQPQPQTTTFHEPPEMAAMELAEGLSMMGISMSESVNSAPSAIWDDYSKSIFIWLHINLIISIYRSHAVNLISRHASWTVLKNDIFCAYMCVYTFSFYLYMIQYKWCV